jgi:hypothetical protein
MDNLAAEWGGTLVTLAGVMERQTCRL